MQKESEERKEPSEEEIFNEIKNLVDTKIIHPALLLYLSRIFINSCNLRTYAQEDIKIIFRISEGNVLLDDIFIKDYPVQFPSYEDEEEIPDKRIVKKFKNPPIKSFQSYIG